MNLDPIRPSQRPGTICHDVLDERVLYCPDIQQVVSLNESARAIWELCDGSRTMDDICAELTSETGLTVEQLWDDVRNAIDRLHDLKLLTRGSD